MSSSIFAIVLAAGKGTRMKSKLYKVLHPVCGKSMVEHVVDTVNKLEPQKTAIVVGHGADKVQEVLGSEVNYALQEEQLGTGHAVLAARDFLGDENGTTLILYGDTPLIESATLEKLLEAHQREEAALTILTTQFDDPTGYGRVIRSENGLVSKIVEEKDASVEQRKIVEINTGIYCFDNQKLWQAIKQINNHNAQAEYYLTDCIEILVNDAEKVATYFSSDADQTKGVNDRLALAEVEAIMKKRINRHHMLHGVTIINPEHTYIGPDVEIGQDTIIHPGSILQGKTFIGEDCTIGPNTQLSEVSVGNGTKIDNSVIYESSVGQDTSIGPFSYVRPGSNIGNECKIGDFVEVKNATIKDRTKISHLSYVGDADLGADVNMGCGSITVNYDGHNKYRTVIEDNCFVGCNTNLIAPVKVGQGSYIAAGSTITDDVPVDSLAIARERQTTKENYVHQIKEKQKKGKN